MTADPAVAKSIEQKIIAKELSLRLTGSIQDKLQVLDSELATHLSRSRAVEVRERMASSHREQSEGKEAKEVCKELWALLSLHALICPELKRGLGEIYSRHRRLLVG